MFFPLAAINPLWAGIALTAITLGLFGGILVIPMKNDRTRPMKGWHRPPAPPKPVDPGILGKLGFWALLFFGVCILGIFGYIEHVFRHYSYTH